MSEPFIGQLILVGFNFAPRGYAFCQGQLLSIAQNTALFSLLGTTFGGNGQTTFGLPDLRGRVPNGQGQGPGLSNYSMGQVGGTESVTLITQQMPAHSHNLNCYSEDGNQGNANGNIAASTGAAPPPYSNVAFNSQMSPTAIGPTGNSQPHDNLSPYLTMNYCIALEGIFPSRN
ncbi:MAG TPA: tail fiber protein [Verrucomicrobiae bacterium]|jgi:microcystin-dependent protein